MCGYYKIKCPTALFADFILINSAASLPPTLAKRAGRAEFARARPQRACAHVCAGGALEGNPSTVKLFFVGLLLSARTHNNHHHRRRRHHPHLLPHCFPRFIHVQLAPASLRHSVASAVTSPTLAASSAPTVSLRLSWIKII